MAEIISLELPEVLAKRAREVACFNHQRLEDMLIEWIDRALAELPVESLPDEQLLTVCEMQMEPEQQEVFSALLACNREGQLSSTEVKQLDELMQIYRHGLICKARAIKEAVARGLKPALGA